MGGAAWGGRQGALRDRRASAMREAVDVAGGVVVKRVSRRWAGFHTGEFHTATLESKKCKNVYVFTLGCAKILIT